MVGKVVMSFVYFSIPVLGGYFVANKAVALSESSVQERFGDLDRNCTDTTNVKMGSSFSSSPKLEQRIVLSGDKIVVHDVGTGNEKVGAGVWGGGVKLATSDESTQEVNRINLERFMKKQLDLKQKR